MKRLLILKVMGLALSLLTLYLAHYAYVLEVGSIILQGTGEDLSSNPDVQKAYLGG